jgi:hypothetical protein
VNGGSRAGHGTGVSWARIEMRRPARGDAWFSAHPWYHPQGMKGFALRRLCAVMILGAGMAASAGFVRGDVVITEILYHPGDDNTGGEFIEILNGGSEPVDLTDWTLAGEISFTFPSGTTLAAGAYLAIYQTPVMPAFYGISNAVGPYLGSLSNGGGAVALLHPGGVPEDQVTYLDMSPWPPEADGGGPSLELVHPTSDNADPASWALGRPYSPGRENDPVPSGTGDVVITEIQYKPLKRRLSKSLDPFWIDKGLFWVGGDDRHGEYVEIFNRRAEALDLAGWKLVHDGGVLYLFPQGTSLGAGSYLAVCADAAAIAGQYGTTHVVGDFLSAGGLSDGGERLSLSDASGRLIDTVRYRDAPPWPVGPDEEGTSLERLDPGAGSGPENWRACRVPAKALPPSPHLGDEAFLDRGTPGASNSVPAGLPPFLPYGEIDHAPARPTSRDAVLVTAVPATGEAPLLVTLDYRTYVAPYQVQLNSGSLAMWDDGKLGDLIAGDGIFSATVPALASQTLVRYRVTVTDAAGRSWTYPDEGEPNPNRAYFVYDGEEEGGLSAYFLIIPNASQATLDANIWTKEYVEATLVADGIVYDHIRTHYRGRGWRVHPKKSWTFSLNKPEQFRGMSSLDLAMHFPILQKLVHEIFWKIGRGNLASEPVRLYRNGSFAGLYLAQESPNTSWLRARGLDDDGQVFKASAAPNFFSGGWSGTNIADLRHFDDPAIYPQLYERKGDGLGPFEDLIELTRLVTDTPEASLVETLGSTVDIDDWLYRWAVHVAGAHGDIIGTNYFVVKPADPLAPWNLLYYDFDLFFGCKGLDFTDVACWPYTMDPWLYYNRFMRRVIDNPELKARFLVILDDLLRHSMTEERLDALIDGWMAATDTDRGDELALAIGGPGPYVLSTPDPAEIKSFFASRRKWLLETWLPSQGFVPAPNSHPTIELGRPTLQGDQFEIAWTYDDPEGDPATVDLFWRDGKWTAQTPVPGGQGLAATLGSFRWTHAGGDPKAGLIVHAVIRDDASDLEGHAESLPLEPPAAPILEPAGGQIITPISLRIVDPSGAGAIYYTVDGEDPMRWDGEISPSALLYREPITLDDAILVRARVLVELPGGFWSEIAEGRFSVPGWTLAITEVMYRTPGGNALEFLELHNFGAKTQSLKGVSFSAGVDFSFPDSAALEPGGHLVIVADQAAFLSHYGSGAAIAGVYSGMLNESGERIALADSSGTSILSFTYLASWYPETNGGGRSLVLVDPRSSQDTWNSASAWRASERIDGSPGKEDSFVETEFVRADSNADGTADLSDAIDVLAHLYLGGQEASCEKAVDSNDDGEVDLSDAIFLLGYLFLGGEAPDAPLDGCGTDPTPDDLTCESYARCR